MGAEEREEDGRQTRFAAELRRQFEVAGEQARPPSRRRRIIIVALVAGAIAAIVLGSVALAGGFDRRSRAHKPKLVAVVGTEGRGYCLKTDLDGPPPPTSPDRARETNEASLRGYGIPVYESDGVTQKGVFRIGAGGMSSQGADGVLHEWTSDMHGTIVAITRYPSGKLVIVKTFLDGSTARMTGRDDTPRIYDETWSDAVQTSPEPSPPDWLYDQMSRVAGAAGDGHAIARWTPQYRRCAAPLEGDRAPTSDDERYRVVWVVVLKGHFTNWLWSLPVGPAPPSYGWIYQLIDPDTREVISEGGSLTRLDTSQILMKGRTELGKK